MHDYRAPLLALCLLSTAASFTLLGCPSVPEPVPPRPTAANTSDTSATTAGANVNPVDHQNLSAADNVPTPPSTSNPVHFATDAVALDALRSHAAPQRFVIDDDNALIQWPALKPEFDVYRLFVACERTTATPLRIGDRLDLRLSVANRGDSVAHHLVVELAMSTPDDTTPIPLAVSLIGSLQPGQTLTRRLALVVKPVMLIPQPVWTLTVRNTAGFYQVVKWTRGLQPVTLSAVARWNDGVTGDTVAQPGEVGVLELQVCNAGVQACGPVYVTLEFTPGQSATPQLVDPAERIVIATISANASAMAEVIMRIVEAPIPATGFIDGRIRLVDTQFGLTFVSPIRLAISQTATKRDARDAWCRIVANQALVLAAPIEDAPIIGTLPHDTLLRVTETCEGFVRLDKGWVSQVMVEWIEAPSTPPPLATVQPLFGVPRPVIVPLKPRQAVVTMDTATASLEFKVLAITVKPLARVRLFVDGLEKFDQVRGTPLPPHSTAYPTRTHELRWTLPGAKANVRVELKLDDVMANSCEFGWTVTTGR